MSVRLRELSIRYGDILAVDRVTADFPPGAVGLLGRNGAGKSSILKALLGLVPPCGGEMGILDLSAKAPPTEVRRVTYGRPLKPDYVGDIGNVLWLLLGTVGIVLVIR